MNANYTYAAATNKQIPRSWPDAIQLYLRDPHAKKMLRRVLVRFLPIATGIAFIDDFLLPGVGFIDDAALPFLIAGVFVMLYKINKYRYYKSETEEKSDRKFIPSQ
jgi:uncharacterized membrane protein YkvA (DUF1232 family)